VLTLALASAALADQVTNRIDATRDDAPENMALDQGESQTVAFGVAQQNKDGDKTCNIDRGEQLVVEFLSSDTSAAAVSPQRLTFTKCNQNKSVTVTAGASGSATISVNEAPEAGSNTTGSGTYHYAPASFNITVNNTPPTISDIANQSIDQDTATSDIPFTVGDAETPASALTLTGSSSNTTLVPNANITFGGSGTERTLKVTPASGQSGTATITATVSDGNTQTTDTFVLSVAADVVAPTVTNATPTGKKVSRGALVTLTFSEAMNEASVEALGTFTLKKKGARKAVSATVDYDPATKIATLDPAKRLRSGAVYTAKMLGGTNGAKDLASNALEIDKIWRFGVR
jgi:Big-like domain-containing protein